jgi:hypothetical protein
LPIAIASVVAILIVGLVTSERENRAREQAQQALADESARERAALEPIRIGSVSHVAGAALELMRTPMVYRDVPAAQPRQARISILEISRGKDPEGRWNIIETQVIQHRLEERRRTYAAAIGAPVHELSLNERGAAHEIIAQLEEAEDALDRVVFCANDLVGAAEFARAAKLAAHGDAVAAVRTHLKAVVAHAELLFRAEQVAKGQIPSERERSA